MKELIGKLFSTTFVKLYSLSLGFVIMFYTLNVLGVEERGEIAIVLSWSSTLFTALYLSLGQIAYRRIKDNALELNTVCSSLLIFILLVTMCLVVIVPICYALFIPSGRVSLLLLYFSCFSVPFLMLEQYFLSLNLVGNNIKKINVILLTSKTISFVIIIFFSNVFSLSVSLVVFSITFANIISGLWFFIDFKKRNKFTFVFSKVNLFSILKEGAGFHIFNALGFILYTNGVLLLSPWFISKFDYGIVDVSLKIVSIYTVVGMAFQTVIMGFFGKEELREAWGNFNKILALYFISFLIIILTSFFVLKPVLSLLINENSELISGFVLELLPYLALMVTSTFVPSLFVIFGWYRYSAFYNIILAFITLSSLIFFMSNQGVLGIISSLKVTYCTMGVLFVFVYCKARREVLLTKIEGA
ncbi:oligosaccharide flippase family protein [Vibrio parahaemolyticus]|uniref:oligosaccharide flippase family protein n=1 Tax=Vibrio parahaemolyticus TaxID=670 RepID=UPI001E4A905D|nr:oligosaccharide flippase family protein [Vibrio parahaemolyticus]EGQ9304205.1 oligosaccharide flippase family protein [Vibrio parahaemolyticus]ELB2040232.1 oligosaccharide flippase family protein [Vibrio parahaemolyticus]ELB2070404.1 oligosaccharide flippase family protein [Vibrio parahaemolyticus]MDG2591001.1 oligosaccharide flippase family protein [Vibrio parahaemolyticus]